jgi:hypothetical protein
VKTILFAAVAALALSASAAGAATLYSDAFSTASDLTNWTSQSGSAAVVAAPGGGSALAFGATWGGGDLATNSDSYTSGTGSFTVSFNLYGACGQTTNCGFFMATDPGVNWFISDTAFGSDAIVPDSNGSWEHVSYTFAGTAIGLNMEDWSGSAFSGPDSYYLRNLVLTDNSAGAAVGTLTIGPAVPEPATWALMLAGIGGIGGALRMARRRTAAVAA